MRVTNLFSFDKLLASYTLLCTLFCSVSGVQAQSNAKRYVIMDNDWGSTGFIPFLIALDGGMDILALASDTANSWVEQCTLHALALLEIGNLSSCIPVVKGETYPLIMTEQRFQIWEQLWGSLRWQGVFAVENLTAESIGNDPTGGNPGRVSKSAFIEGYPNTTQTPNLSAAQYMVEQVHKYPGQVSIYSAGALTNVAAAVRMNSSFASMAKELVIMGGYTDLNLFQTTSAFNQDLGSDINFIVDPEAAHIAITAAFPDIIIAGNVANNQYLTTAMVKNITSVKNPYTDLMQYYPLSLPLWDETPAAIMAYPELITSSALVYADVSIAYDSPFLGNLHLWSKQFAPSHTRPVKYVLEIDQPAFYQHVIHSLKHPPSC